MLFFFFFIQVIFITRRQLDRLFVVIGIIDVFDAGKLLAFVATV